MSRKTLLDPRRVRDEIALAAARLIAEDGLDYAGAKRKAARQVLGDSRIAGEWLPDNDQIEEELHEYLALFQSDTQPAELRRLRLVALAWMERLAAFNPYVAGAVLNGTANAHSDIHLQTFCDNHKDVAIYLLNQNIQYDVSETRHFAGRGDIETLSLVARSARRGTRRHSRRTVYQRRPARRRESGRPRSSITRRRANATCARRRGAVLTNRISNR